MTDSWRKYEIYIRSAIFNFFVDGGFNFQGNVVLIMY